MSTPIRFTREERTAIGGRIRDFFAKELDQDIADAIYALQRNEPPLR